MNRREEKRSRHLVLELERWRRVVLGLFFESQSFSEVAHRYTELLKEKMAIADSLESSGLLNGLCGNHKINTACLIANQFHIDNQEKSTNEFYKWSIPLVRRAYGESLLSDLISLQPIIKKGSRFVLSPS